MKLSRFTIGLGLLVVVGWLSAHLALIALLGGLAIGYLVGRFSGRRKAVVEAAREIVSAHARTLGRGEPA
jgi:uncharacterized membrane-anchored protein YhcB (DUF1043 family)